MMTDSVRLALLSRMERDGVDGSSLNSRALGIAARIYEDIDAKEMMRRESEITVTSVCKSVGISRTNATANKVFSGIINAHRNALPDSYDYRREKDMEKELRSLRTWHEASLVAEMELLEVRNENRTLQNKVLVQDANYNILKVKYDALLRDYEALKKRMDETNAVIASGFLNGREDKDDGKKDLKK